MSLKKSVKLVCVDDDLMFLNTLSGFLKDCGYNVHTAHNTEKGFNLINSEKPDIALIDINMPEKDGLDLIGQLRHEQANNNDIHIPYIILLTGMAYPEYQIAARRMGCDDYIVKSDDFSVILAAIEALENSH